MNGSHIKQAAIQKAKQVANASNGNANKKRKKELKPIITTEGQTEKPQSQPQEKVLTLALGLMILNSGRKHFENSPTDSKSARRRLHGCSAARWARRCGMQHGKPC